MAAEHKQDHLVDTMKEVLQLYGVTLNPEMFNEEQDKVNYQEVLAQTQDKIEELNQQANTIAEQIGMSREELEAYAQNPNNFTKQQWETIQHVKQECEVFKENSAKALAQLDVMTKGMEEEPPKKKEKSKFGKKKKWLQL